MVEGLHKNSVAQKKLEDAEREIVERSRRIDFYMSEYTIELLVEKMATGEYVIPDYQREYTWDLKRKSRFIESLVMGLPVPFLFFWTMPNGKLEIVDGSQRLRTLKEYIRDGLKLSTLETIPSLSKTRFLDLSESRQRKIKNWSIRGIILNEGADDQARRDMFDRINTGSLVANTAEVRRGALPGPFLDLVIELSREPAFEELAPVSTKAKNERVREELVTRFFAYGDGLDSYTDSPKRFIFEYTKSMNELFLKDYQKIAAYRSRFLGVLNFVRKTFPNGFKKSANAHTTPRVRFEAIAIGSYLALKDHPEMASPPFPKVSSWIDGKGFLDVTTSDAANVKSKIVNRFNFVRDALVEDL
jgi:hypothetical protein